MIQNTIFQQNITTARLIDRDISKVFLERYNFYNYDNLNKKKSDLKETLASLKKGLSSDFLVNKEIIIQHLDSIEKAVETKYLYLDRFKSHNAIFNNSFRYLSVLRTSLAKTLTTKDKEVKIAIATVFPMLMQLQLGAVEKKEINRLLNTLKKNINPEHNHHTVVEGFITHSKVVLKYDTKLKELLEKNNRLQMEQKFYDFAEESDSYFKKIILLGTYITIAMIIIVAIFSLLLWKFYRAQIKDKQSLKKFKNSVETSDNIVLITDKHRKVTYVNDTFEKITGYRKEDILGKDPKFLSSGTLPKEYYKTLNRALDNGEKWSGEFINKKKDGTIFYDNTTISPIYNEEGKIDSFIAIKLDVTKDKEYQNKIEEQNREIKQRYFTDELTHIPNRNRLLEDLKENNIGVLILINIDNFNEFKFFYGIEAADRLLMQTAELLTILTKTIDSSRVYRLEKDEFCIWSENLEILNTLDSIMEDLHEKIAKHSFYINRQEVHITATLGGSYYYYTGDTTINDLIIHGDLAHRFAKQNKLPFSTYNPQNNMEEFYKNNMIWTQRIEEALIEDRIINYYQPIVDNEGQIKKFENLVRIVDRDGTIITPNRFLEVAKQSNQYTKITKRVIKNAFNTFRDSPYNFTINIDYEDIESKEIIDLLKAELAKCTCPERFTAEILESDSIKNYEKVVEFISDLKSLGSKIAIDDFGSGYSNFSRVSKLDVDYIKIDGTIIKEIDKDLKMKKIAESIVHFGKNIGKEVIAEFVCNEDVLKISKEVGVDYFQGYHFSKPKAEI